MRRESTQWIDVHEDYRERILRFYQKGENHLSSGFQKGDEIRQEAFLSELHPFYKKE
jgi:hypothetical protein